MLTFYASGPCYRSMLAFCTTVAFHATVPRCNAIIEHWRLAAYGTIASIYEEADGGFNQWIVMIGERYNPPILRERSPIKAVISW